MLTSLSGNVSHMERASDTRGSVSTSYGGYVSGSVYTNKSTSFRINNRPIAYHGHPNLSDGDNVLVIGAFHGGEFIAIALTNKTTGIIYYDNPYSLSQALVNFVGGAFLIVVGIANVSAMGISILILVAMTALGLSVILATINRLKRSQKIRTLLKSNLSNEDIKAQLNSMPKFKISWRSILKFIRKLMSY